MTRPLPPLVLLAVPALLVPTASAQGDDGGYYLELGAGFTGTVGMDAPAGTADYDTGYQLDALLGREWERALFERVDFSLELEAYYNRQNFDDVVLQAGSSSADYLAHAGVVLGGVLTYPLHEDIALYGGLGVGYAGALTLSSGSDAPGSFDFTDDGALIGQAKVGLRYALAPDLGFFVQYKRLQSEELTLRDANLDAEFDYEIEQNVVEIGLRWGL